MSHPLSDVAVVIVTFNSERDIDRALEALPLSDLGPVVIVDNSSTDGTRDSVSRWASRGVRLVQSPNKGFGAGCNVGLEEVRSSRFVLFLNPDAAILPKDLDDLRSYLAANERVALVAPRLFCKGQPLHSAGDVATVWTEVRFALPPRLGSLVPDRRRPAGFAQSGPVGVVEGACMLFDRAALEELGGFDERFFLFFEEHDLARRIIACGREVHLFAGASAEHRVGGSRESLPGLGTDHYLTSLMRYLRKWQGPMGARLISALYQMTAAIHDLRRHSGHAERERVRKALNSGTGEQ